MQDATDAPRGAHALRVDPDRCPGSVSGSERLPSPGERVYTNEGTAVVVRLLGRTGSGGRLLELAMDDGRKAPFFASAANIRVAALGGAPLPPTPGGGGSEDAGPPPRERARPGAENGEATEITPGRSPRRERG